VVPCRRQKRISRKERLYAISHRSRDDEGLNDDGTIFICFNFRKLCLCGFFHLSPGAVG
jgi:hypothetical protein